MITPKSDRAAFVTQVSDLLWPGDDAGDVASGAADVRMLALPSPGAPRMLVPIGPARINAAGVRGLAAARTRRSRLRRDTFATALRLGAGKVLAHRLGVRVGTGGIGEHLSTILETPLHIAVSLGPPRANRKPVILALHPDGRPAAYAKLGVDPLTNALVEAEAAALDRLAQTPPTGLTVPALLHAGSWHGASLIVQTPLDTRGGTVPRVSALATAMRALATLDAEPGRLTSSPAWVRSRHVLAALEGPRAAALRERAARLERLATDAAVRLGAWHGDWAPWNVAVRGGATLAWDWERFATGVPIGWDALHWSVQHAVGVERRGLIDAARGMLAARGELVALCSDKAGGNEKSAMAVACAYLVEVGSRYVHDKQDESGAVAGAIEHWLLPVLDSGLAELEGGQR